MPRALVIIVAAILAVACGVEVGVPYLLQSAESQPAPKEVCVQNAEDKERIQSIMLEALDEALHDQFMNLLLVWLKDSRGQPDRARVGVQQAIAAHQQAKRLALEWVPPICSG